jgi:hypothetical protein
MEAHCGGREGEGGRRWGLAVEVEALGGDAIERREGRHGEWLHREGSSAVLLCSWELLPARGRREGEEREKEKGERDKVNKIGIFSKLGNFRGEK